MFPDEQDVIDLLNVLAGGECAACDSVDIDGNGVYPDDADVSKFFENLTGFCDYGFTSDEVRPDTRRAFVAPGGDDSGPCTAERPCASVMRGVEAVQFPGGWPSRDGGIVEVAPGSYVGWIGSTEAKNRLIYGGSRGRPLVIRAWDRPGSNPGERPTINLLPDIAGMVIGDDCSDVVLRGLEIVGTFQQNGVVMRGSATRLRVEDCLIRDVQIGFNISGMDGKSVTDFIAYRTTVDRTRSATSHSQGAYVAGAKRIRFIQSAFLNCGNNDIYSHLFYFVPNSDRDAVREVRGCWLLHRSEAEGQASGYSGIQARGGPFTIVGNVVRSRTGVAWGHYMAYQVGIKPSGLGQDNLIVASDYPGWGVPYMDCDGVVLRRLTIIGASVALVPPPLQDAKPVFQTIPGGDITFDDIVVRPSADGYNYRPPVQIDWLAKMAELRARPRNAWGEQYDAAMFAAEVRGGV